MLSVLRDRRFSKQNQAPELGQLGNQSLLALKVPSERLIAADGGRMSDVTTMTQGHYEVKFFSRN
jgi:hypothetical protein